MHHLKGGRKKRDLIICVNRTYLAGSDGSSEALLPHLLVLLALLEESLRDFDLL